MRHLLAQTLVGFIVGLGAGLYVGIVVLTVLERIKIKQGITLWVLSTTAVGGLATAVAATTFLAASDKNFSDLFMSTPTVIAMFATFATILLVGYAYFFLVSSGKTKAPKETWMDGPMRKP